MCVYRVIAYLPRKTPLFIPLTQVTTRLPQKLLCQLIFSVFSKMVPISGCTFRVPTP